MLTDWIIYTKLYDNLKKDKSLDNEKLNNIIEKVIEFPFKDCLNDLIIDEKIEILFENPKICIIFESIELNETKITSIRDKFINLAIRNNFEFDDLYKNENSELYDFYENMLKISCVGIKNKCTDCNVAARKGHLVCLKYAHENGCKWDKKTCQYAAENGHLECLKYAHENGCPWDENECFYAAYFGHLKCLQYVHKNDCSWDKRIFSYKYTHENGSHWDKYGYFAAMQNGCLECAQYMRNYGCPY
ncbi:ankyrin repeat domain-containing protein [Bodo saltans virus]|uniref:Ankyrin repeat domain-containing protein n=1 Tax=Bodo saltans virus TaxID=2024608 RepID=A0A2H4UWF3_9VIRU|nr:ankyrin repeat domain-containing protein [Bodo saltans virus]ATZ81227.1 ankyrin repeat domain-containing protein [Bodo saltans virus]